MTRTLDPFLEELRQMALRMGGLAEAILDKALRALFEGNAELGAAVKRDDLEIDQLDVAIDETVVKALARQAPVAEDLRRVLSIRTMATDLERVGDLARNIAKSAGRLAERAPVAVPAALRDLADETCRMLRDALDAFAEGDVEKARRVLREDDRVDEAEARLVRLGIEQIGAHPEHTPQEVDFILVAKNLERVADHATNIAEDVIFLTEARVVRHEAKLRERAGGR